MARRHHRTDAEADRFKKRIYKLFDKGKSVMEAWCIITKSQRASDSIKGYTFRGIHYWYDRWQTERGQVA